MINSYIFGGICLLIVLCMVTYTVKKFMDFKREFGSKR